MLQAHPLLEVGTLEELGDGGGVGEPQHRHQVEVPVPLALATDLDMVRVHDGEELVQVGPGVGLHGLRGELGTGYRTAAGITDPGGEVPDDQDRQMPLALPAPQQPHGHRVPQMEVRSAGIDAELDAQLLVPLQPLDQMLPALAVDDPAQQLFGPTHELRAYRTEPRRPGRSVPDWVRPP